MDWLLDNAQLILFIILAIAGAVKQWMDSREEQPLPRPVRTPPPPLEPEWLEEEPAPPPPLPQRAPPARNDRKPRRPSAPSGKPTARPATTSSPAVIAPARDSASPVSQPGRQVSSRSVKGLLRSRESLRRAFVLREILGPPASLR